MKRKVMACFLCFVMALSAVLLFSFSKVNALTNNLYTQEQVDNFSRPYTNSDDFNYIGKDGRTYKSNIRSYPNLRKEFQNVQNRNDPIINIIPIELLSNRSVYYHIGKEYGFFMHSMSLYDGYTPPAGATINPTKYSTLVTVFVFDITYDLDYNSSGYHVKIEPLFCYDYAYIETQKFLNTDCFYYWQPYYENWEYGDMIDATQKGFVAQNGMKSIIIPIPDGRYYKVGNDEHYDERWQMNARFGMRDIAVSSDIRNVNSLNVGDAGYDVNNDNGAVITQVEMKARKSQITNIGDEYMLFSMAVSYVLYYNVGVVWSGVNDIISLIDSIQDKTTSSKTSDQPVYSKLYPNSICEQMRLYGHLFRSAGATVRDENKLLSATIFKPSANKNEKSYIDVYFRFGVDTHNAQKVEITTCMQFTMTCQMLNGNNFRNLKPHAGKCGDPIYMW